MKKKKLANIGEKEYSKTVEEACFRLTDQKWISVDERLPEEYENVLVCAEGKVTVGQMWLFGDGSKLFTIIGVTHWMPLPKPPKGE